MAIKSKHEVIGVVENMSYFKPEDSDQKYYIFGKGGGEELASQLGTDLLGQSPIQEADENSETPAIAKRKYCAIQGIRRPGRKNTC